ncbi:MAG: TIGR00730 family Rossman fold protein [Chlorobi bacterium]|nr:TIGR00730 family Rossman fold protein [Chlorobiota bacterium]
MKNIAVFCGSNPGNDPEFKVKAEELGRIFAARNIRLVYGGGNVGLMKIIANAVLENKGTVTGVITNHLAGKELAHNKVNEMIRVETMQQRKAKMTELSDAFIALPGGFGTLEELFEVITLNQLELHKKPVGILNVNGYYNHLKLLMEQMVKNKLLLEPHRNMMMFEENPEKLLARMQNYEAPNVGKWIEDIVEKS